MKKYIIDEKELKRLIEDSWELNRLICNGVDNWIGYEEDDSEEENIDINEYISENYEEAELI
jgi:hypothetical protein